MNQIEKKREREKQMLQESCLRLYDLLENEKETAGGVDRGEQSQLRRVLQYYHLPIKESAAGLQHENIEHMLRRSGLITRRITLDGAWWKEASVPLLLTDEEGKQYTAIPSGGGRYCVWRDGKEQRLNSQNTTDFQSIAYCFYKPFPSDQKGMKMVWRFLWESISVWDIFVILGISLMVELCGLILPYINSVVYNTVIPSGTSRQIPGIVVLVISTVFFSALISLYKEISVARIGEKMKTAGQSAVWWRLLQLPASFFKRYDSGELYQRADAIEDICKTIGGRMIPSALTAVLSLIYLFQVSFFAERLLLPSVVIICAQMINIALTGILQIRLREKENKIHTQVTSISFQLIKGIQKIKTAGAQIPAFGRWAKVWENMPVMGHPWITISPIIGKVITLVGSISLYCIAWKSEISASNYIAFQTAFSSFVVSVMMLADFGFQFGSLKPAVNMLRPLMEESPELYENREYVEQLNGQIELNQVRFRYIPDMPYVLDGLNLQIKAGEYLGIVGESGCGKSTLMRILLGFETPETGSVYFDGRDLGQLDLPSLRRRIGVVLQDGKLFAGDIFDNIAICAPWLTMEEAWEAAERAGFAEDIRQMPMGMFTMISEEGGGISGGQRQRLLIARALASDPGVLLFDEATSALDNETQSKVVDTLKNMNCTRVVIAHRLSTIRDCDRIIYLEHGRVVEQGDFEGLMEKSGKFAKMAQRQLL